LLSFSFRRSPGDGVAVGLFGIGAIGGQPVRHAAVIREPTRYWPVIPLALSAAVPARGAMKKIILVVAVAAGVSDLFPKTAGRRAVRADFFGTP
jgi:hypothetical protein